jgi:hypothetical protein
MEKRLSNAGKQLQPDLFVPAGVKPCDLNKKTLHPIHQLQSQIGNRAASHFIQAKLQIDRRSDQYEQEADCSRKASCACGGPRCPAQSTGLPVSQPSDTSEIEADRIADKIMGMPDNDSSPEHSQSQSAPLSESASPIVQTKSEGGAIASNVSSAKIPSSQDGGSPLDGGVRSFMQNRFGADFSDVKVHTGPQAVQLNRELNARAFTIGKDIYFDKGQYRPDSFEGKQLLAHELTHTLQQQRTSELFFQRKKYDGKDDAGFYEIDDEACTFAYRQDWYFDFADSNIAAADQPAFMTSGKSQIESGWSGKYKLISGNKTCPCGEAGFTVDVKLNTLSQQRKGKHGYTINVEKDRERSITNPLSSTIKMEEDADVPKNMGHTVPMDIMSHEFGHTLGLQDEYNWWAALFGVPGSGDKSSLMHRGNDVKPWHYQHFADMLNLEMARCIFYPEGGVKRSSLAEPVSQLGLTTGAFYNKASLDPSKAEFIIGLHIDTRVSNNAVLGLFYPTLGFDTYWNSKDGNITMGPTAGLRLNRLAHPLYLDISTGLLFGPEGDNGDVKLNVPLSTTLGLRGKGFNLGVNYTPMFDLLNGGKYSHIVGLNLQFDVK